MFKQTPPTSFEVRNPAAYREYCQRETKKTIKRWILVNAALLTAGVVLGAVCERMDRNN